MEILDKLYDYFPTSVFTGRELVFVSEDWKVEITEHKNDDFSRTTKSCSIVRVKIYKKALNGEFLQGHYQDFHIDDLGKLADQIERYIQSAVGKNIKED